MLRRAWQLYGAVSPAGVAVHCYENGGDVGSNFCFVQDNLESFIPRGAARLALSNRAAAGLAGAGDLRHHLRCEAVDFATGQVHSHVVSGWASILTQTSPCPLDPRLWRTASM